MNIKTVSNNHAPLHAVKTAVNPQSTALVDEVVVAQEMPKPTKDLPNVFSLQARAAAKQSKKAKKKPKIEPIDPYDRSYLLQQCNLISMSVCQIYNCHESGRKNSGYNIALKKEITNYLNSVGTPTALKVLIELYPK
jgi:hypothetical protein